MLTRALIVSAIAVLVACGGSSEKDPPGGGDELAGDGDSSPTDDAPSDLDVGDGDAMPGDDDGDGDSAPTDEPPDTLGTIRDVKTGVVAVGDQVRIEGVVVTAVGAQGYFVQKATGATQFDGIYVYSPSGAKPGLGDIVDLGECAVQLFSGQLQLASPAFTVIMPANGAPLATAVAAADIAQGGSLAANYEGMLVRVDSISVTSTNFAAGEFTVNSVLTVDDFLYAAPLPSVGTSYSSLIGVLRANNGDSKLEPRSAADYFP